MAELYGRRISAVLAADTALKLRTGCASFLYSHFHKTANTCLVKSCKRIGLVDLSLVVGI